LSSSLVAFLSVYLSRPAGPACSSTLSLHDALPIFRPEWAPPPEVFGPVWTVLYLLMAVAAWLVWKRGGFARAGTALGLYLVQLRSEEHTSELQSRENLVCRLLLEKKKHDKSSHTTG